MRLSLDSNGNIRDIGTIDVFEPKENRVRLILKSYMFYIWRLHYENSRDT